MLFRSKTSGFEVSDRIVLRWATDGSPAGDELAAALEEHVELVAREVLATTVEHVDGAGLTHRDDDLGLAFSVERVTS